jgi:hypothetical protein
MGQISDFAWSLTATIVSGWVGGTILGHIRTFVIRVVRVFHGRCDFDSVLVSSESPIFGDISQTFLFGVLKINFGR